MARVYRDRHEVIFIDYLEKERSITGAYYAALFDRLVDEIRKKRPHLKKKKILFHDDSAPSYTSNIAQAKKHTMGVESLPHPPYFPDLVPSDYCFDTLRDGCVAGVLSRTKNLNEKQMGILEGLTNRIICKA